MNGIIQANTANNDLFYREYASLLRVHTNIGDLC